MGVWQWCNLDTASHTSHMICNISGSVKPDWSLKIKKNDVCDQELIERLATDTHPAWAGNDEEFDENSSVSVREDKMFIWCWRRDCKDVQMIS